MKDLVDEIIQFVQIDGAELARRRIARGLTRAQFARASGVHPSRIGHIESHRTRVTWVVFDRIMDVLNKHPENFIPTPFASAPARKEVMNPEIAMIGRQYA